MQVIWKNKPTYILKVYKELALLKVSEASEAATE
jgi:hypothetical protein